MGFYYDWLEERWSPIDHDRVLTRSDRRRIERHGRLIADLLGQLDDLDGITFLYASLLARTLAASDELLMMEHGEKVATLTAPTNQKRMVG
jgi:hypothetical protein